VSKSGTACDVFPQTRVSAQDSRNSCVGTKRAGLVEANNWCRGAMMKSNNLRRSCCNFVCQQIISDHRVKSAKQESDIRSFCFAVTASRYVSNAQFKYRLGIRTLCELSTEGTGKGKDTRSGIEARRWASYSGTRGDGSDKGRATGEIWKHIPSMRTNLSLVTMQHYWPDDDNSTTSDQLRGE